MDSAAAFSQATAGMPDLTNHPEMMTKASQVWEMLDEMAASNPAGYRKFLEKQMKEKEKWEAEQKKAHVGVKTGKMNSPKPIYINLCSSTKVQEPASEEAPIPVVICRLVQQPGPDKLMADTYDVVYHPKMIERLRKEEDFKEFLIRLSMQGVQEKEGFRCTDAYTVLDEPVGSKTPKAPQTTGNETSGGSSTSHHPDIGTAAAAEADPNVPEGLLGTLSSITRDVTDGSGKLGQTNPLGAASLKMPMTEVRPHADSGVSKPLIETLDAALSSPVHSLSVDRVARHIKIAVELPECPSIGGVDVDITATGLSLLAPELYKLELQFPHRVDDSAAVARFVKSKRKLKLTLPLA